MDAHRLGRDLERGLAREQLRHPGLDVGALARLLALRRVAREQARRFELRRHVGELHLDRLVLGDRLAHRAALLRVRDRGVERGPRHADCTRRDVDAPDLERAEDVAEPAARVAEQRVGGNAMVVVRHLDGLDALVAELADVAAHGDAAERPAPAPSRR